MCWDIFSLMQMEDELRHVHGLSPVNAIPPISLGCRYIVKQDKSPNPLHIRLFSLIGVMLAPNCITNAIKQLSRRWLNLIGCGGIGALFFSTGLGMLCCILIDKTLLGYITVQKSCYYTYWLLYITSCVIFILYR